MIYLGRGVLYPKSVASLLNFVIWYCFLVSTHVKMYLKHQVVNSLETYVWLPRFLITRGCLRLVIASRCSWQRRISWCPRGCCSNPRGASRLVRSSSARAARRCFFVSSGTSICASILAHGRAPLRVHPSDTRTSSGGWDESARGFGPCHTPW